MWSHKRLGRNQITSRSAKIGTTAGSIPPRHSAWNACKEPSELDSKSNMIFPISEARFVRCRQGDAPVGVGDLFSETLWSPHKGKQTHPKKKNTSPTGPLAPGLFSFSRRSRFSAKTGKLEKIQKIPPAPARLRKTARSAPKDRLNGMMCLNGKRPRRQSSPKTDKKLASLLRKSRLARSLIRRQRSRWPVKPLGEIAQRLDAKKNRMARRCRRLRSTSSGTVT